MSAFLHSRPAGRRRYGAGRFRPMSEINVTPLVDVMLVLLIVFMVTAPLLTTGIPVDLPEANADPIPTNEDAPLLISIDPTGRVFLGEEDKQEVEVGTLVAKLRAMLATRTDRLIFVRGDKAIDYGRVMEVMGEVKAGGFEQVTLVVESPDQASGSTQDEEPE